MGWQEARLSANHSRMKQKWLGVLFLAVLFAAGCSKQHPNTDPGGRPPEARTFSSFDLPTPGEKIIPPRSINFDQTNLTPVLNLYAELSGRSIICVGNLPEVKITFCNQTPLRTIGALQALDTVLAAQGITTVYMGSQYVKVVPEKNVVTEPGPVVELSAEQLPESSSFLTYIVTLKNIPMSQASAAMQPFAKLPNSILGLSSGTKPPPSSKAGFPPMPRIFGAKHDILVLRDYSSNVKRMLQVLDKIDQPS